MLMSQVYAPTLREVPAEAELVSHRLMLRAGLMRKSAAGIYTYLPLGFRVMQKIMDIIRQEMHRAGAQEIMLPIIQPAELWHETGRWDDYGEEMFKLKDRHQRQFCLGPTHEEIITALVRADVRSYRQLPLRLYQIQNKYRDEIRPRFGVVRGREFIMKDCYSFDRDQDGLQASYEAMYAAYERIFQRCGLAARPVEADSGAIGGDVSHEFMVLADAGEAEVVYCQECSYAANVEKAECTMPKQDPSDQDQRGMQEIATPNAKTVEQVTEYLAVGADNLLKTLIYRCDDRFIAAVIRGDHQINEVKLRKALQCTELQLATPAQILEKTGGPIGFSGPVGLTIPIYQDQAAAGLVNAVVGANKEDMHLKNVNMGRDYTPQQIVDIRQAAAGDRCPHCSGILVEARGIEVGQVFKLGTKYSQPLKALFLDEQGQEAPMVMGCYGIGVSRTAAAIIEQNHDSDGICWPVAVAPCQVLIVPVNYQDESQRQAAEKLYNQLTELGVEVLLDDRSERPGVKFKDADLIGIPIRVTIGPKGLRHGSVEITLRREKAQQMAAIDQALELIQQMLIRCSQ